jgi:hypothetical protein
MPVSGSDRLPPWAAPWLPVPTATWRVYIAPAQYISLVLNLSAQRWRHLSNRAPSGLGPSAQNAQVGTVDLWGRTRGAVAGPARRTARAASHK